MWGDAPWPQSRPWPTDWTDMDALKSCTHCVLLDEQFATAERKGYSLAHDQEHGPRRLIQAGHAYTMCALTRQTRGVSNDGHYLWPFADGWNPGPDPAVTLVKAAQLLLSAADVLIAEGTPSGSER